MIFAVFKARSSRSSCNGGFLDKDFCVASIEGLARKLRCDQLSRSLLGRIAVGTCQEEVLCVVLTVCPMFVENVVFLNIDVGEHFLRSTFARQLLRCTCRLWALKGE